MKIIVDARIREIEYKYLAEELKLEVKKLPVSDDVYEEISGHSDIFYTVINDKVICAPNSKIIEPKFIIGKEKVGDKYPEDVKYNICQIGKHIIGSKYADDSLKDKISILVNQGYSKCSICITGDNSAITTDKGIYKALKVHNIDAVYVEEDNIHLLNKNGEISNMKGFIGGCTAVIDNTFILFGDSKYLSKDTKEKIQSHIKKYNLKFKEFENLKIIDYGGIVMYKNLNF